MPTYCPLDFTLCHRNRSGFVCWFWLIGVGFVGWFWVIGVGVGWWVGWLVFCGRVGWWLVCFGWYCYCYNHSPFLLFSLVYHSFASPHLFSPLPSSLLLSYSFLSPLSFRSASFRSALPRTRLRDL
jgi:hypothetical protein